MKQWFKNYRSRFRPLYWRSLVYMLQATEYDIREYLRWYHRTHNFTQVERRKRLVMTPKALLLFTYSAVTQVFAWIWGGYGIYQAFVIHHWLIFIMNVVLTAISPYITAYSVLIPLLIGQIIIQKPRQRGIVRRAQQKLQKHDATKIAVAGSYGKTSFREILKDVLGQSKRVAAPPASFNTPLGISKFVDTLRGDEEVLIFELGEYYPGDIRDLSQLVDPSIGIITGINEAHLSKFKTLDRTVNTIFELGDHLGENPLYVNGESALAAERVEPGYPFLYSRKGVNGWEVTDVKTGLDGTSFTATKADRVVGANSQLLGLHQIGPLVAAIDIADALGLTAQQIKDGIAATKPFEHRLQPRTESGVVIIDDSYNGNPDGARVAIEFLASLVGHRRWCVTPGLVEMGERTEEVHQEIGRQLAKAGIEQVVLFKNSATPYIAQGLNQAGFKGKLTWFDDALKGFAALPNMTVSGDVVLIQNDWTDNYA